MPKTAITGDMIIGTVMERHPETVDVFRRYFGKGCFGCPGSGYEDIEFGSNMHGADLASLLKELNEAAFGRGKAKR